MELRPWMCAVSVGNDASAHTARRVFIGVLAVGDPTAADRCGSDSAAARVRLGICLVIADTAVSLAGACLLCRWLLASSSVKRTVAEPICGGNGLTTDFDECKAAGRSADLSDIGNSVSCGNVVC